MKVQLDQISVLDKRRKYGVLDLMSDIGGVLEITIISIGFIFLPISEHSFIVMAASKLFFGRTNRDDVFEKTKPNKFIESMRKKGKITQEEADEVIIHKSIKFSSWNMVKSYFLRLIEQCCGKKFYSRVTG